MLNTHGLVKINQCRTANCCSLLLGFSTSYVFAMLYRLYCVLSKKPKLCMSENSFLKSPPAPPPQSRKKEMQINATINKYHSSKIYPSSDIHCSILKISSKCPEMGLLGKPEFLDIFTNPQMAKECQRPTSSPPPSDFSIVPTPNPSQEQENANIFNTIDLLGLPHPPTPPPQSSSLSSDTAHPLYSDHAEDNWYLVSIDHVSEFGDRDSDHGNSASLYSSFRGATTLKTDVAT